ncbi:MAG TPA: hypothetical protein VJ785_09265 [Anaerolineales bacterium]|nr:hypothetical protein [Anaerolineales bacterium]
MPNPFGPDKEPGLYSHVNFQKRVLQNVQSSGIDDQIFIAVQKAFEEALHKENIPLIRLERKRLFVQVMRQVLNDMVTKLDNNSRS